MPDSNLASVLVQHLLKLGSKHSSMLRRHVSLPEQIETFFHGTLATLVYISAGCTHEEKFVRGVSLATTFMARQSLPAPSIIVSGRSTMGARLRSSTKIASLPFTSVLLPGAMILVRFFLVVCSCYTDTTTIHFFLGSNQLRFRSAALDFLADCSHRPSHLGRHQICGCDRSLMELV